MCVPWDRRTCYKYTQRRSFIEGAAQVSNIFAPVSSVPHRFQVLDTGLVGFPQIPHFSLLRENFMLIYSKIFYHPISRARFSVDRSHDDNWILLNICPPIPFLLSSHLHNSETLWDGILWTREEWVTLSRLFLFILGAFWRLHFHKSVKWSCSPSVMKSGLTFCRKAYLYSPQTKQFLEARKLPPNNSGVSTGIYACTRSTPTKAGGDGDVRNLEWLSSMVT